MPLNFTPRAPTSAPQTAQPQPRPQVTLGKPAPSTARAEALKARLMGQPNPQAQAPRPGRTSARQADFAAAKAYQATPQQQSVVPRGTTSARQIEQPENFPAQPSGLAGHVGELSQTNTIVEAPRVVEAANEPVVSPQFIELAKQTRMIRKAQQALKAERDAWKVEQARFIPKDALTSDPLKALADAGVSYDRLVELQLNQANPDPNQQLHAKIAELEAKLAGVDKQFVDRDTAAYNNAVNQIRRDAKLLVDSDPTFETIKATGQTEAVVELVKRIFHEEGDILSVEDAAKIVEDKAVEKELERLQKISALAKIKSRLGTPPEVAEEVLAAAPARTLTNQGAIQRPLTARERAILAYENAKTKA